LIPSSRLAAGRLHGLIFLAAIDHVSCRKKKNQKTSYQNLGSVIGRAVRDARATTNEVI